MKPLYIVLFSVLMCFNCAESQSKTKTVGGPCEGCEAIFEYGERDLKTTVTLPEYKVLPNPIKISGTVYKSDGKTPANGVILYVYQTDHKGIYPSRSSSKGWEKRHGYIRGWMKTDASGNYEFYTSRPASYPNTTVAQHIHLTVKETDKNEYYLDDFYFKDDPNITQSVLTNKYPRGGSGVLSLESKGNIQVAKRNIILGLHIPNY